MDYKKIGNFITTERKSKKLTQAKLAEKIFVSEKTVSKWENGNGLPDTHVLPKLCEVLNVSLNELLSGEKADLDNNQNNEPLLLNMAKELERKNKIIWKSMWLILIAGVFTLLTGILVSAFFISHGISQLISIFAFLILFLILCCYALRLEVSVGAYKCKNCEFEIVPSYREALWSMHRGTTRYLKCPNCHKCSWCKKVIK